MRRVFLIVAGATVAFALPFAISAAPFPAQSEATCSKAGGTYSESKDGAKTKTCVVPGTSSSVIRGNGEPGYTVEVSSVSGPTTYTFNAGNRDSSQFPGATAVTRCWMDTPLGQVEIIPPSSDPKCHG
jgi:hypothetical protein